MIDCTEAELLLAVRAGESLSETDEASLLSHLRSCDACVTTTQLVAKEDAEPMTSTQRNLRARTIAIGVGLALAGAAAIFFVLLSSSASSDGDDNSMSPSTDEPAGARRDKQPNKKPTTDAGPSKNTPTNRPAKTREEHEADKTALLRAIKRGKFNEALRLCEESLLGDNRQLKRCFLAACRGNSEAHARRYLAKFKSAQTRTEMAAFCLRQGLTIE